MINTTDEMKTKKIDEDENQKKSTNFVDGNNVYILGDFDKTISINVIPKLVDLINSAKFMRDPEIDIYINSYGGFASELLGLMTMIEQAKKAGITINTYNIGCAYSCGSLLSIIGDHRYMYRFADNLPHLGQVFIAPQTVEQLNRGTQHACDWFSTIYNIYATYTKMPKKELMKVLKDDDYHMNAEECLKNGFCDEII